MLNDVGIPRMVRFVKKASFFRDLSTRSHKGYEEHVKDGSGPALSDGAVRPWEGHPWHHDGTGRFRKAPDVDMFT